MIMVRSASVSLIRPRKEECMNPCEKGETIVSWLFLFFYPVFLVHDAYKKNNEETK